MSCVSFFIVFVVLLLSSVGIIEGAGPAFRFVLVHGGGHGAWCWYKVTSLLQQVGHQVNALDLISAGTSNIDPQHVTTLVQYSAPVIDLFNSLPVNTKVVLVGHSLGGATLTYLLEGFPDKVLAAVYVAALMLPSGPEARTINNQLMQMAEKSGTVYSLEDLFYGLSPPEDKVLGMSLYKASPGIDPSVNFTTGRYGRVPRYYIKTLQDRVIPVAQQDLLIRTTPPTGVLQLNSDHSPFFSRPADLVNSLISIARKTLD